jgi:Major Facilitator Superfamily
LINVPFGLLSALLLFIGLKYENVGRPTDKVSIDYLGIITLIPALVLLLLGLNFGGDKFEWVSGTSFMLFGGSIVLLLVFGFIENKAKEPILDLTLFKNRVFATTNALGFLLGLGMFGAIMFVPMFMQGILGVTPTQAGSTMTPMMIALIAASIIGGRLLLRLRYRTVLTAGMLITVVGFFLMSTMGPESKEYTAYMYMIVMGFGMGLVMPTLMIAVQNEFPKSRLGAVTSSATFFRSIGGTIGITVLNAVMNQSLQENMKDVAAQQDNPAAAQILGGLSEKTDALFGLLVTPGLLEVPKEIGSIVIASIETAWSDAFTTVFLTGLIFIAIGVGVALSVGNGKIKRDKELQEEAEKEETILKPATE